MHQETKKKASDSNLNAKNVNVNVKVDVDVDKSSELQNQEHVSCRARDYLPPGTLASRGEPLGEREKE